MQTQFGHLQLNVAASNITYYKDLFAFLGWQVLEDHEGMLGVGDPNRSSVWFIGGHKDVENDYDGPGMNHLAIHTTTQAEVDEAVEYLRQHDIETLFDTPRHRAEFSGPNSTYYQVMFKSPDNILFEIVYMGPRS